MTASISGEARRQPGVLLPPKHPLAATDRLIDRAVYRLYGLTDDEIAIVEEHNA